MMRLTDRNDYQQLLASLLEPLKLKMTEGKARIRLQGSGATYSPSVQEMEAFARPLWGLVPFWAGGGSHPEWEEIYQTGIANGTNPEHPEYWGDCTDHDQRFVEMAPLAYGLLAAKHVLWEPLSVVEQDRFVAWLRQINDHTFSDNNWRFFRVLVNLALARVGKAHDAGLLESDLTHIESWHVGSGWYVDGQANQKDYYGPFALHFYGLLYAQFAQESDPKRSRQFVELAKLFANDFIYWFDREGRALPYGRSLTYRFAQSAFFSAALDHLDPALAKGVIGRNLRFWMNQEIFEGDKTLSVGYAYPNMAMAEKYNAPGSPYWALKVFNILRFPSEHPIWKVEEASQPMLDPVRVCPDGDMVISHRGWDATAFPLAIYNRNVLGHFVEKYAKFAYSTAFGFSVAHSSENLKENAPDSMLSFIVDDRVYVRRRCKESSLTSSGTSALWSPLQGIEVRTIIQIIDTGHIRTHHITSDRSCFAYDAGFAINQHGRVFNLSKGAGWIEMNDGTLMCRVEGNGTPYVIDADPNTNVLHKKTKIPAIEYRINAGVQTYRTHVKIERRSKVDEH